MPQRRDPQPLGPLADKALVFIGELASGADDLSARDEKRLNELTKKARDRGLTAGERMQVVRLAYKAVPSERVDDLKRFLGNRGSGRAPERTRLKLKK